MEIASIKADCSVCQAAGLVSRVLFMDCPRRSRCDFLEHYVRIEHSGFLCYDAVSRNRLLEGMDEKGNLFDIDHLCCWIYLAQFVAGCGKLGTKEYCFCSDCTTAAALDRGVFADERGRSFGTKIGAYDGVCRPGIFLAAYGGAVQAARLACLGRSLVSGAVGSRNG